MKSSYDSSRDEVDEPEETEVSARLQSWIKILQVLNLTKL